MNEEDIQEQPALIGALAEAVQAGFEAMSVPFLVYGIAIPFGTVATYLFVHFGLANSFGLSGLLSSDFAGYFCRFILDENAKSKSKEYLTVFLPLCGAT